MAYLLNLLLDCFTLIARVVRPGDTLVDGLRQPLACQLITIVTQGRGSNEGSEPVF